MIDTRPGFLGIVFNGIEKTAINNTYRGTLLGNSLNLEGVFDESAFDGFQFNYNINALGSPVPLPSALVLFISCFGFLKLKLKRP